MILGAKKLIIGAFIPYGGCLLGEPTHSTNMLNLPLVRCASLRGYRELVTQHGGDPQALLATAGLGLVPIEEENLLIPSHCLYNALEVASRELDIPDFGLQLSEYQELDILGLFALMPIRCLRFCNWQISIYIQCMIMGHG